MTEPQANLSPAPAQMPGQQAAAWLDGDDYALGCECADPALHIDGWRDQWTPAAELS